MVIILNNVIKITEATKKPVKQDNDLGSFLLEYVFLL